jgi:hypothetical protein
VVVPLLLIISFDHTNESYCNTCKSPILPHIYYYFNIFDRVAILFHMQVICYYITSSTLLSSCCPCPTSTFIYIQNKSCRVATTLVIYFPILLTCPTYPIITTPTGTLSLTQVIPNDYAISPLNSHPHHHGPLSLAQVTSNKPLNLQQSHPMEPYLELNNGPCGPIDIISTSTIIPMNC